MLTQLKHIGLSENEAKVYLAMLELGPSPVLEIAAKAGINRPTAYVQIESLKKMGLVSTQIKGKKQLFIAEDPDQLEILLTEKEKELEHKKEELEKMLPALSVMFNTADEKPQVRYFEGIEGIKKVQKEFLQTKSKLIYAISFRDDLYTAVPNQGEYVKERVKRKIHTKFIYSSTKGRLPSTSDRELLVESRFIPPEQFPKGADITVFDHKVAIASLQGKVMCTVIEHGDVAKSFRGIFDLLWASAEK